MLISTNVNFLRLKNIHDLRSFMGMENYLKRFITQFFIAVHPLIALIAIELVLVGALGSRNWSKRLSVEL
jgi:hypothetical protein